MKKFENPQIEVQVFAIEDVVTTSTQQGAGGENELDRD